MSTAPFHVFVTGVLAMAVQVVLLRELSAAFYGVDLIYLLALGAWLLWTAAGALISRRSMEPSPARVGMLLLAVGVVIPLEVALVRGLRILLGGVSGAYLPLPEQLLAGSLCLLPPATLLGLLFQWTAKRYMAQPGNGPGVVSGRSLARAYAIESAGGLVGGGLATWTLVLGVQNVTLALGTSSLALAAAMVGRQRAVRTVALALLAAGVLATCESASLDRWMTSWTHPDVVETADSPHGRVTITERAGQVSVYENDALALESEGTAPEELAHLAMIQHPAPQRVLLVGGAGAALLGPVLEHRPRRVDDIDINRTLVALLQRRLPASGTGSPGGAGTALPAAERPEVRVRFDDPRRAFARIGGPYDVLIVAAAEPASAQANRFYTREFFAQCASWLNGDGVLAFRLSSAENLWTPQLAARAGSIYLALRAVFRDVVVLPGSVNIVIASTQPLERDSRVLGERLERRQIRARLVSPRYVGYLYSNDRFAEIARTLERYHARPNTDANPVSYQATAMIWLSKFLPSIGQTDLTWVADAFAWSGATSWLVVAGALLGAIWWRPRRRKSADAEPRGWAAVMFAAAFTGMAIEMLLLLEYQLKQGVVYRDLGVLLMSVMAGLAAGAWLVDRQQAGLKSCSATDRVAPSGGRATEAVAAQGFSLPHACGKIPLLGALWRGRAVAAHKARAATAGSPVMPLGLLALLALLVSLSIRTGIGTGPVPVALMLLATGVLVGSVFGRAGAPDLRTDAQGPQTDAQGHKTGARGLKTLGPRRLQLVGPLYAADVLGGCAGSIVASLFLIPLLGLPLTGEWVAALTGIATVAWSRGWR